MIRAEGVTTLAEPPPCPSGCDPTDWGSQLDRAYFAAPHEGNSYVRFMVPGEVRPNDLPPVPAGYVDAVEVTELAPGARAVQVVRVFVLGRASR